MSSESNQEEKIVLKTSLKTEPLDILETLQSTFAKTKNSLRKKIQTLEQQVQPPPAPASTLQAQVYHHKASTPNMIPVSFGVQSPQTIELLLHVEEKSKGFLKGKTKHADFSIKVIALDHPVYESFQYEIPAHSHTLPLAVVEGIVTTVEKAFFHQIQENSEQETYFVRAVENFLGIAGLANHYFTRKYTQVCGEAYLATQSYIDSLEQTLELIFSALTQKAEQSLTAISSEGLKEAVEAKKIKLEQELNEEAAQARSWIQTQKQEIQALTESYEHKCAELEKRLEGQRQHIDAHAHEILPALEDLFPDVGRSSQTYAQRIDHDLRVFYAKLLQQDLQKVEGASVNDSLVFIRLLRDLCFPKNERPKAADLRELYGGMRAVLHHVSQYATDLSEIITNIANVFKYAGRGPKPSVEKVLETALATDLDFSHYTKSLHSDDARNKKDLQVL